MREPTSQPVTEAGWRWHIVAGPDGNEFVSCRRPRGTGRKPGQTGDGRRMIAVFG
jgi:hypothetical protein